jgi:Holliday junction resolvase RusA-like endonuclease
VIAFTILGEPASKANSRKVATFGNLPPMLIKSDKARGYEKTALLQIPPVHRVRLAGPVRITMRIFYASERPDLDESLILDILQDRYTGKGDARRLVQAGVYQNDRQVREKHIYHAIDRKNPRTEIVVQSLVAQADLISPQAQPAPAQRPKPVPPSVPVRIPDGLPF